LHQKQVEPPGVFLFRDMAFFASVRSLPHTGLRLNCLNFFYGIYYRAVTLRVYCVGTVVAGANGDTTSTI
jgi:hypothetical protein